MSQLGDYDVPFCEQQYHAWVLLYIFDQIKIIWSAYHPAPPPPPPQLPQILDIYMNLVVTPKKLLLEYASPVLNSLQSV